MGDDTNNPQAIATAIRAADMGDKKAAADLFVSLYGELHRLARLQLLTLGATTLLHERCLNLSTRSAVFAGIRAHRAA